MQSITPHTVVGDPILGLDLMLAPLLGALGCIFYWLLRRQFHTMWVPLMASFVFSVLIFLVCEPSGGLVNISLSTIPFDQRVIDEWSREQRNEFIHTQYDHIMLRDRIHWILFISSYVLAVSGCEIFQFRFKRSSLSAPEDAPSV